MAKKNRLKFILLGLLQEAPQTGYDLEKSFDSDIGEFWSANHSQIYPLLKKLETEALIQHKIQIVGEKLPKKVYSITANGLTVFEDWLVSDSPLDTLHDEFILKLYFIRQQQDPRLAKMLSEQYEQHAAKLDHLLQQKATKFADPATKTDHYGHFLILEHAINRERDYRDWLKQLMV